MTEVNYSLQAVITFNAAVLALPTERVEIELQLNDDEAGQDKSK